MSIFNSNLLPTRQFLRQIILLKNKLARENANAYWTKYWIWKEGPWPFWSYMCSVLKSKNFAWGAHSKHRPNSFGMRLKFSGSVALNSNVFPEYDWRPKKNLHRNLVDIRLKCRIYCCRQPLFGLIIQTLGLNEGGQISLGGTLKSRWGDAKSRWGNANSRLGEASLLQFKYCMYS